MVYVRVRACVRVPACAVMKDLFHFNEVYCLLYFFILLCMLLRHPVLFFAGVITISEFVSILFVSIFLF